MNVLFVCFFISPENICCGNSLEVPLRGTSNDYPQHLFVEEQEKYINIFWLRKKVPYLQL